MPDATDLCCPRRANVANDINNNETALQTSTLNNNHNNSSSSSSRKDLTNNTRPIESSSLPTTISILRQQHRGYKLHYFHSTHLPPPPPCLTRGSVDSQRQQFRLQEPHSQENEGQVPRRLAERHPTEVFAEDGEVVLLVPVRGEVVRQ